MHLICQSQNPKVGQQGIITYVANKDNDGLSNGAVLALSKIIEHVMTSASEAEVAALFYNCKATQPLRIALEEMGDPQPKTPVITDNKTAEGLTGLVLSADISASNRLTEGNSEGSPTVRRLFEFG